MVVSLSSGASTVPITCGEESTETARRLNEQAAAVLGELESKEDEAATLVNAVGANTFAAGYGVHANEEKAIADRWRLVAVVAMLVVGGLGVVYLFTVGQLEFSWQGFWIRAVIILPPAFIAAYAARQSGRHRRNEIRSRQLALELLAIDPYLALLEPAERNAVKMRLADRFFGNANLDDTQSDGLGLEKAMETAASAIRPRRQ